MWNKAEEWRNWFLLSVPLASLMVRSLSKELYHAIRGGGVLHAPGVPDAAHGGSAKSPALAEQGA